MKTKSMNSDSFKKEIFDYTQEKEFAFTKDKPIILNFFATWCGPCQAFKAPLESIAEKYENQLSVYKIDIDSDPEIPGLFGVRSVPTTIFFIPNQQPAMVNGNIGEESLERAVSELFQLK